MKETRNSYEILKGKPNGRLILRPKVSGKIIL
jgi:hypothetical protein